MSTKQSTVDHQLYYDMSGVATGACSAGSRCLAGT